MFPGPLCGWWAGCRHDRWTQRHTHAKVTADVPVSPPSPPVSWLQGGCGRGSTRGPSRPRATLVRKATQPGLGAGAGRVKRPGPDEGVAPTSALDRPRPGSTHTGETLAPALFMDLFLASSPRAVLCGFESQNTPVGARPAANGLGRHLQTCLSPAHSPSCQSPKEQKALPHAIGVERAQPQERARSPGRRAEQTASEGSWTCTRLRGPSWCRPLFNNIFNANLM